MRWGARKLTSAFVQARDNKLTLEDMAGGSFTMCVFALIWAFSPTMRLTRRFAIAAPTEVFSDPSTALPSSTLPNVPSSVRPFPFHLLETELTSLASPGMHSIKDRAVVVDGKIVIRPIMVVALTCVPSLSHGKAELTTGITQVRPPNARRKGGCHLPREAQGADRGPSSLPVRPLSHASFERELELMSLSCAASHRLRLV